jgi:release factor glutamine methyltransferase
MKEQLSSAGALYRTVSEQIYQKRSDIYTIEECRHISMMLMEHYLGQQRNDVLLDRQLQLSNKTESMLDAAITRIINYEPIQYVIGETYFYDRAFYVSPAVLVPRRETEELTDLIIREQRQHEGLTLLDIGTGSGCIAITLQKELRSAQVSAMDISQEALAVAKANAIRHRAEIDWLLGNILQHETSSAGYDIIVSNPPYVQKSEAAEMKKNVLDFEPSAALFVGNEEPLIFYDRIAQLCTQNKLLQKGGQLYFEINELYGANIVALLEGYGFSQVLLKKDMQGKDRFVSAKLM